VLPMNCNVVGEARSLSVGPRSGIHPGRLVLIAARGNHPHRAHAAQADISSRNCLTRARGLFSTQSSGGADAFCIRVN
jgi:hypothetical protein